MDYLADLGMDDEGDDDPVPLPNVNAAILKKVLNTQPWRHQRLVTNSNISLDVL